MLSQITAPDGFVYFAGSMVLGMIKIGHALNPIKRIRDIAIGSPVPLRLYAVEPGRIQDEKALHRRFKRYRKHGEWFEFRDGLRAYVEERALPEVVGFTGPRIEPPSYRAEMAALDRRNSPSPTPLQTGGK